MGALAFEDDLNDYVYYRATLRPLCTGHVLIVSKTARSSTAINFEDSRPCILDGSQMHVFSPLNIRAILRF